MDSSLEMAAAVVFFIVAVGAVLLTFFSAALHSAVNPQPQFEDGSEHRKNVGRAAGAIILYGIKRKIKRMIFRGLI
jgi:hypothetical protein